jgi:hypothetical protein
MTNTTRDAVNAPAISFTFDYSGWVVDYGGGITQRFTDRQEAITAAKEAAAIEGRSLDPEP